ncbi:MAG: FAD-dependent oxidoreductase [Armatimonadetes bacterium]|nr:FAD-dependent oxidoreductase [Armatimonadota bacterium]
MPKLLRSSAAKTAHTPLFDLLRRIIRTAASSLTPNAPPADELLEMRHQFQQTRRQFIKTAGIATAAIGAGAMIPACRTLRPTSSSVRVAIIGAGMAGLNAAWELQQAGITPAIFEASGRAGGRMFTANNIMAPGLTTELGGEFIDSTHTEMLRLIKEFDLPLLDTQQASESNLVHEVFYFNGGIYTEAEVIADFTPLAARIKQDYDLLPEVLDFQHPENAGLDNQSIGDYLSIIGATGRLRKLLEVAYITEYGLDIDQQSAINFLLLIGADLNPEENTFAIFGTSDERFKVQGGNQRVPDAIAAKLAHHISIGHTLEAIRPEGGNRFALFFQQGNGGVKEIHADVVILTLPFSVLRSVDLSKLDIPAVKRRAIAELGYGTNAKLMVGLNSRPWREQGFAGYCFTDEAVQMGWDNSQLQPGNSGGFTMFSGGTPGIIES